MDDRQTELPLAMILARKGRPVGQPAPRWSHTASAAGVIVPEAPRLSTMTELHPAADLRMAADPAYATTRVALDA